MLPAGPPVPVASGNSMVRLSADAPVLSRAQDSGTRLALAKKGSVLAAHGKAGEFWRVEWEKGRVGFLPLGAAKEAPGAKPNLKGVAAVMQSEPPQIRLANLDTSRGGLDTDQDHLNIAGSAADANGMRDLQIFVQHENDYRKVFFRTAKKGQQQTAQAPTQMEFNADLPLKPGNSTVVIIAREDDDLMTQKTIVVHRKQPVVAQKQQGPRAER